MRSYLFTSLAAAIILSALALPVRAQSGSVILKVDPIDEIQQELDDGRVNSKTTRTPQVTEISQERYLRITLTNRTKEKVSDLKVKYFLFLYDLKDGDVKRLKFGTLDVSLDPSATQVLESEKGTTIYHPPQIKRPRGRVVSTALTPAGGKQQAGYGVQVFKGKTLLAEMYTSPTIKQSVGKQTN